MAADAAGARPATASASGLCEGCGWHHESTSIVSVDAPTQQIYETTRLPMQEDHATAVQQGCVRALSCEVSPRERPLMFGNAQQGYTLSFAFNLADQHARGHRRYYTLMVVCADRLHIVHNWAFFTKHCGDIIAELQAAARQANDLRLSESTGQAAGPPYTQSPVRRPSVADRLAPRADQLRSPHRTTELLRSLGRVTGKGELVVEALHQKFVWIIQQFAERVHEKQVRGPSYMAGRTTEDAPLLATAPTDVQCEVATVARIARASRDSGDISEEECRHILSMSCSGNESVFDAPEQQQQQRQRPAAATRGYRSLAGLAAVLSRPQLGLLLYNVSLGNQCIVRSDEPHAVVDFITAVTATLPDNASTTAINQDHYCEAFEASFLGLLRGVNIPGHIDRAGVIVVDLDPASDRNNWAGSITLCAENHVAAAAGNSFVAELLAFYYSDLDCEGIEATWLDAFRERWMHKAKAYFKVARRCELEAEERNSLLCQSLRITGKDFAVLKFLTACLSRPNRRRLLTDT